MENLRKHGAPPFLAALVHGGPGAAGDMEPLAKTLASDFGALEPLQTRDSVDGQAEELAECLSANASGPVALVGHSWGAWLCLIVAARRPELVSRLILVGSGPFEEKDAREINDTRLARLSREEQDEIMLLFARMKAGDAGGETFSRFGKLFEKADSFSPLELPGERVDFRPDIHGKVWAEAAELRRSGRLLELAASLRCPVTAIHGDHDPHPWRGVRDPLEKRLTDFKFVLLEKCGHKPWAEKFARDEFLEILRREIRSGPCFRRPGS